MAKRPVKIIQISDTHLMEDGEGELSGVPTQKSFHAVVDLIKQNNEAMDLVILTGDIAQDGSDAAYKQAAKILKELDVPVYWVAGNHDDARVLTKVYPLETISNHKHIILKHWHLILLNSQLPEEAEGHLDQSQLTYMKHCLDAYPEHNAIIVFHHHPLFVGSKWLDRIGMKNAADFWEAIAPYPKVHSVLFGHVHQEFEQKFGHVNCFSAPSTCLQFKRNQARFSFENLNPGYRWIHLHEDGKLKTGVKRTAEYVGKFDPKAKGY